MPAQPNRLAPLVPVAPFFRICIRSLYQAHRRGAAPWLTHLGPDGKSHRGFFVDPDLFQACEAARGRQVPQRLADELNDRARAVVVLVTMGGQG